MTDNEIIKAWECCTSERTNSCFKCPFYKLCDDDNFSLVKATLDLINRQKAEIKKCENIIRLADKTIEKQSAEIKRLEQENFDRSLTVETWKCEAVKEFAERLKEKQQTFIGHDYTCKFIYLIEIDNLVKEMVGEQNV